MNFQERKNKQLEQGLVQGHQTPTTTKIKQQLAYASLALILLVLFYFYRAITPFSDTYLYQEQEFSLAKKQNAKALAKLKKLTENTTEYKEYLVINTKKNQLYRDFVKTIDNHKVNGFDSLHHFLERLGRNTQDVIFVLWVVYVFVFGRKSKSILTMSGRITVCAAYLSTKIFTFFWIFTEFQDYSLMTYIFVTMGSAVLICLLLYKLFEGRKTKEQELQEDLLELAKFTFKHTKPEKREEMLDMMKVFLKP